MNIISKTHQWILEHLQRDAFVIDMTCGNGHDTKFLAKHCQSVIAVDIQKQAIDITKNRVKSFNNVQFIHQDHQNLPIKTLVPIHGVIYNLGYLPHGDKSIITQKESTIASLNSVLPYVQDFIVITCYPGHVGGDIESVAVKNWIDCQNLTYTMFKYETNNSPIAYCIELT